MEKIQKKELKKQEKEFRKGVKECIASLKKCKGYAVITTTEKKTTSTEFGTLGMTSNTELLSILRAMNRIGMHIWNQVGMVKK